MYIVKFKQMENNIYISSRLSLPLRVIDLKPIRSGGPGGQHVNKVSTGIELRLDLLDPAIPPAIRKRILGSNDNRITQEGILILQATQFRSQTQNRKDAIERLIEFLRPFTRPKKKRIPTKISLAEKEKRLQEKKKTSEKKAWRKNIDL